MVRDAGLGEPCFGLVLGDDGQFRFHDCQPGLYCGGDGCAPPRAPGEACAPDEGCVAGYQCIDGRCVLAGERLGDRCTGFCAPPDLACPLDPSGEERCVLADGSRGAFCAAGHPCSGGLACVEERCADPVGVGEPCLRNRDCISGECAALRCCE